MREGAGQRGKERSFSPAPSPQPGRWGGVCARRALGFPWEALCVALEAGTGGVPSVTWGSLCAGGHDLARVRLKALLFPVSPLPLGKTAKSTGHPRLCTGVPRRPSPDHPVSHPSFVPGPRLPKLTLPSPLRPRPAVQRVCAVHRALFQRDPRSGRPRQPGGEWPLPGAQASGTWLPDGLSHAARGKPPLGSADGGPCGSSRAQSPAPPPASPVGPTLCPFPKGRPQPGRKSSPSR